MNKKSILTLLLDLVFLIVFNIVFFVVSEANVTASAWISYGFIHFSYLMILITPRLVRKGSAAAVLGFPLYAISAIYFIAEFVIGIIFILVNSESFKLALVVQLIFAGIYAVLIISNMLANEHTADSVSRREDEVAYIKDAASRVKLLVNKSTDKKVNKEIEKIYDLLHSSPTRSIASVKELEGQIANKVTALENAVALDNQTTIIATASELTAMIEERNRKLRTAN